MSEVPLDTFDFDYNGGSTANTISRNPFFTGDTFSRGANGRQSQLSILQPGRTVPTSQGRYAWQDQVTTKEPDRLTIRTLLLYLITEFTVASVALFGFIVLVGSVEVPIAITSVAFGVTLLLFIVMLAFGRRMYPFNVLSYHVALPSLLVFVVHCLRHNEHNADDLVHPMGVALLICLAGALCTLILTALPSPQVDNQMLYIVPPIVVTALLSIIISFASSRPLHWNTFQLIPVSIGFMLPSSILTTFCIRGYNLRC